MKYRFNFLYKRFRHVKYKEEAPVDRNLKRGLNQDIEEVEDEADALLRQIRE